MRWPRRSGSAAPALPGQLCTLSLHNPLLAAARPTPQQELRVRAIGPRGSGSGAAGSAMQINAVEKVEVLCGLEVDGPGTATKVWRMLICTALLSLVHAGRPLPLCLLPARACVEA